MMNEQMLNHFKNGNLIGVEWAAAATAEIKVDLNAFVVVVEDVMDGETIPSKLFKEIFAIW